MSSPAHAILEFPKELGEATNTPIVGSNFFLAPKSMSVSIFLNVFGKEGAGAENRAMGKTCKMVFLQGVFLI